MKMKHELLLYPQSPSSDHVYLATINTTVKANGELIMGGGNALAFAQTYPDLPRTLGAFFNSLREKGAEIPPFMIMDEGSEGGYVGGLVTKTNPRLPSPFALVRDNLLTLQKFAEKEEHLTFHLPMPAVGLGGLSYEQVLPLVEALPANVVVYYVPTKIH